MTELSQKMIKTMELKDLSENTQKIYLQAVTGLASNISINSGRNTKGSGQHHIIVL